MKVIDGHVHLGRFNVSCSGVMGWLDVNTENLMQYIDEHKLSSVFLLSHPHIEGQYDMNGSEETLGLAQSYPKIKPFCQIDRAAPECIGRYIDKGCVGIGEIKLPLPINDPKILAVLKTAKEFNLPVVVHTTDKFCFESTPTALSEALSVGANIIWHGWGWWNKFKDRKMESILTKYPNAFMDISANSGYNSLAKRMWNVSRGLLENFSDRILYGTDFPMLKLEGGSQFGFNNEHIELINSFNLSESAMANIMYRNAERLVK